MTSFQDSIRSLADHFAPSIVIGTRLGKPGEMPGSLRDKLDPWAMWSDQASQSLGGAVQIAFSQRLGKEGSEDALAIVAGLRMIYMKLVSDMADSMNISEGELHNQINEFMNNTRVDEIDPPSEQE